MRTNSAVGKTGPTKEWSNLPEWITTEEAAELSGYHPEYVRRLARRGKIGAEKKGRDWWIDPMLPSHASSSHRELSTNRTVTRWGLCRRCRLITPFSWPGSGKGKCYVTAASDIEPRAEALL